MKMFINLILICHMHVFFYIVHSYYEMILDRMEFSNKVGVIFHDGVDCLTGLSISVSPL